MNVEFKYDNMTFVYLTVYLTGMECAIGCFICFPFYWFYCSVILFFFCKTKHFSETDRRNGRSNIHMHLEICV